MEGRWHLLSLWQDSNQLCQRPLCINMVRLQKPLGGGGEAGWHDACMPCCLKLAASLASCHLPLSSP